MVRHLSVLNKFMMTYKHHATGTSSGYILHSLPFRLLLLLSPPSPLPYFPSLLQWFLPSPLYPPPLFSLSSSLNPPYPNLPSLFSCHSFFLPSLSSPPSLPSLSSSPLCLLSLSLSTFFYLSSPPLDCPLLPFPPQGYLCHSTIFSSSH